MRKSTTKFVSPYKRKESSKSPRRSQESSPTRTRSPKKPRLTLNEITTKKPNDELAAFTHFLTGKSEMGQTERQAMIRQQVDQKLYQLLAQKETGREESENKRKRIARL